MENFQIKLLNMKMIKLFKEHHKKGLKYVNLEDFNKLYVEDTVEAQLLKFK